MVAMAITLLTLFVLVVDWGLTMASTQRRHIDHDQLSTLFWINAGGGLLLALLMSALSPLLVLIYDEPRLIGVSIALSITLFAKGLGAQHEAILRRRLRYGVLHISGVVGSALGLVAAIVAALAGMGVWSLVWHQIVLYVSQTVLLWIGARWRPARPSLRVDVGSFLRYGNRLVPAHLLRHLSRSFDSILIGAVAGATELGLYKKAHGIVTMPLEQMIQPVHRIVPASLSRLQDNDNQFSRFYLRALETFALVGWSVVGLIAAEAPSVVYLLLGAKWLAAAPLVRWLSPGVLVSILGVIVTEWALIPRGNTKTLLVLRAVRLGGTIAGVLIGWLSGGLVGVAVGYSAASVVMLAIEMRYAASGTGVPAGNLIGTLLRPMFAAACAASFVFLVATDGSIIMLLMESCLYVVLFIAVHAVLPGGWQVMRHSLRLIREAARLQPAT